LTFRILTRFRAKQSLADVIRRDLPLIVRKDWVWLNISVFKFRRYWLVVHPRFTKCKTSWPRRIQVRFTVRIHSQKQSGHEVYFRFRVTGIISMGTLTGGYRPFNVFPGSFCVSSLTYLDSGVTQGGGTVIWPWSHRKLSQAAMQSPDRYNILSDFKNPQQRFDLGEPIELRPSRGDVLFFHYLLVHSGSLNTSNKPRFALRLMCTCATCRIWEKNGKWNIWMPWPIFD